MKVLREKEAADREMRWQAENDTNTLVRAKEIREDKERMSNVRNYLQNNIQQEKDILNNDNGSLKGRNPATINKMKIDY